ncbi:MAG: SDR family oxidoreductase [Actinomycetes bacterium]|jgi:NAD(P)-dependent dehydrogenase (short-subunit alcohol dehydrogenase family)
MDLNGKTTIVTGAANGIGAALARRFHAAGARVVVADRDASNLAAVESELNAIRPGSALAVVADISTEQGNIDLIEAARAKFGFVNLFFANAGVAMGTDLTETDEATWSTIMDINLNAHRWAAKHLIQDWLAAGEGYFCSTASAAGLLSQIGSATYSVTKHAAVAFAEWMSITYGDRGVRVSCLCPQGVNTNMLNPPDRQKDPSGAIARTGGDVVKASGEVLEPREVADIVYAHILEEHFLIMPHPEVHTYEKRKVEDRDRWLAGMRRLQSKILG